MRILIKQIVGVFMLAGIAAPVIHHAFADDAMGVHNHMKMQSDEPRAGHHHMMPGTGAKQEIKHTTVNYTIPPIQLVREDGKTVDLAQELDDGRAVVLNFIYTTCTEICPLTSHTFSKFQANLGKNRDGVHMISISIDPEQDTPAVLRKYARKYKAGPQWDFYTGTAGASVEAQKTFAAYRGDKMNHVPATYMRAAQGKSWLRIEGFASPDELLLDYKKLISAK